MHKLVGMCDFTCHESTTALFPLPTFMFYFYLNFYRWISCFFFNHSYGLLKIFCCSGMNLLQKAVYKVWRPLGNASLHARGKQRALRVCSRERGGDNSLAHDNERYVCVRGSRQGGDAVEESFSSAPLTFALWERPGAPPSCSHVSADWTPRRWRPSSALLYAAALRWEEKMHKFSHSNGECDQIVFTTHFTSVMPNRILN